MPHAHLAVINEYLLAHDIFPVGRFGEWKYLNQDGEILSAKRVVESVQDTGRVEPIGSVRLIRSGRNQPKINPD